jgi:hypothetical protein
MTTQYKHGPQQVTGVHTYSKITKENLLSVTAMQLLPVAAEGDAAELLEKKQLTRPRQAKKKNVTKFYLSPEFLFLLVISESYNNPFWGFEQRYPQEKKRNNFLK